MAKLLGYDSVPATVGAFGNYAFWARWVCLTSGTVTSLRIYMGTAGTYLRLALYTDNAGAPGTVLAQGTGTGTGWVSQAISQAVVAGTYYHLAAVSDGATRTVASGGDREYKAAWGNNAFTNNPSGTTPDAAIVSIYGDGTASGWTHIAEVSGIAAASMAERTGVAVAAIAEINGVAV